MEFLKKQHDDDHKRHDIDDHSWVQYPTRNSINERAVGHVIPHSMFEEQSITINAK